MNGCNFQFCINSGYLVPWIEPNWWYTMNQKLLYLCFLYSRRQQCKEYSTRDALLLSLLLATGREEWKWSYHTIVYHTIQYLCYLRSNAYGSVCCIMIPYQGLFCLGFIQGIGGVPLSSHSKDIMLDNTYSLLSLTCSKFKFLLIRLGQKYKVAYRKEGFVVTLFHKQGPSDQHCTVRVYHSNAYGSVCCVITCLLP